MTVKKISKLAADQLTNKLTAFRTFDEMVDAMRTGYVPTLPGLRYRLLRSVVRAAGFKAFDGVKTS